MTAFRKIKASLVNDEIADFIGEPGNIFFNIETGELRLSDGVTPGGLPLPGGSINPNTDLSSLESLTGIGFGVRTAADTWATRSIVSGNGSLIVTNGDGVAGNVVVNIRDNPELHGTEGVILPRGQTSERGLTPVNGTIRYNETEGYLEGYLDGKWIDIVDGASDRFTPEGLVLVGQTQADGEFTSISAAVASITDASESKPYTVRVSPGVYVEPTIVMKPHVNIFGGGVASTVIQSLDPDQNLVEACANSAITDLTLTGATGTGASLVYMDQADGNIQNPFIIFNVILGSAYGLCRVLRGNMQINNIYYGGTRAFVRGFTVQNTTTGARMNLRNAASTRMQQPYPEYLFKADGSNAFLIINGFYGRVRGLGVSESVPAGIGIWQRDGSEARVSGCSMFGLDKAVWIENAGAPSRGNYNSMLLDASLEHLVVDHPLATGSFSGTFRGDLSVDDAPDFVMLGLDENYPGTRIKGSLLVGTTIADMTDVTDLVQTTTAVGLITGGTLSRGDVIREVDIAAGIGYASTDNNRSRRIEWSGTSVIVPDNQYSYIAISNTGNVIVSATPTDPLTTIRLGGAEAHGGTISRIMPLFNNIIHHGTKNSEYLREVIGSVVVGGLVTSENGTTPRRLNVTNGSIALGSTTYSTFGATPIIFSEAFRQSGEWSFSDNRTTVNNTQYDNGTDLVSLTTGYYTKHLLLVAADTELASKYYLVIGQAEYATEPEADASPLPATPPSLIGAVPIAAVVVQQGVNNVSTILDVRPRIGVSVQDVLSSSDHGSLQGLSSDDHPQYLLVSGTRAMTGNLDMGTFSVTNVGLVDGIDLTAHGSRHNPNGVDPVATATAVELSPSSTNTAGINNSLARSDHTHRIDGFQPLDADLTAVAALATTGIAARTAVNTWQLRTITGTTDKITVTDGDAVSGNPTINIASTYVGQTSINTLGNVTTGTWNGTTISVAKGGTALTSLGSANQVLGVNSSATSLEYKTLSSGIGVNVDHTPGVATVNLKPGTPVQMQYINIAPTSTSAIIPYDSTTPLITEGSQIASVNITTTTATPRVKVEFDAWFTADTNNRQLVIAVFRGNICISTSSTTMTTAGNTVSDTIMVVDTPPAGTHTYSVRVGTDAAAVLYINRTATVTLGGVPSSSLILTEF